MRLRSQIDRPGDRPATSLHSSYLKRLSFAAYEDQGFIALCVVVVVNRLTGIAGRA